MDEQTLTPFVFEGETIRVIRRNLVFWFVAADICRALGISNPSQAVKARRESERSTICLNEGGPDRLSISESGLYALILRSDGALTKGTTAYRFRDWVTMEVLPSVRAQGSYTHTSPVSGPPEALKVRIITEARKTFGTRSSGELWFYYGMPIMPSMRLSPAQADLFHDRMGTGLAQHPTSPLSLPG